jgi:hypothetical protein
MPLQDYVVLIERAASLLAPRLMLWPSGAAGTLDASCASQAISLALAALSFDFVGTCLDESSEDLGTIQVLLMSNIGQGLRLLSPRRTHSVKLWGECGDQAHGSWSASVS